MKKAQSAKTTDKVLLVSEDVIATLMFNTYLSEMGFSVDPARKNTDAVRMMGSCDYDALILDLGKPETEHYRLYERIKNDFPKMQQKVIFLASYTNPELESFLKETGQPALLKPFSLNTLKEALHSIL